MMLSRWSRNVRKAAVVVLQRNMMFSTSTTNESFQNLPLRFLRDSDKVNFDPVTRQRIDVSFDDANGKPSHDHNPAKQRYQVKSSRRNGQTYEIDWADGVSSQYSIEWVHQTAMNWKNPQLSRELWTGMSDSHVRNSDELSMPFEKVIHDEGMAKALKALYNFGILLITETPTDDGGAAIAALASAVSGSPKKHLASISLLENYRQGGTDIVLPDGTDGPLRTLYGSVWFTKSSVQAEGTSVADSAYGLDGLPLHTDMTYMLSPPGLQIFTMIEPALEGGESIYADGFAAAEILRSEDPHAFNVLCNTDRRYHSIDKDTGWHLEATGPVIETRQGQIVRIRHNDLDRLPDLPPYTSHGIDSESFYTELADAHAKWDDILGRDSTRLEMKLRCGDTVLVANQRCMHGRYSFQIADKSPRAVSGCYVSQDDLNSRFRMEALPVLL
mmetsp:Transcript_8688/g.14443  ORF Transcript_8688/g.14443 Transcript_8688/m.14443 type:complete len:443 (-) Transcript_8688:414-1742(-)